MNFTNIPRQCLHEELFQSESLVKKKKRTKRYNGKLNFLIVPGVRKVEYGNIIIVMQKTILHNLFLSPVSLNHMNDSWRSVEMHIYH